MRRLFIFVSLPLFCLFCAACGDDPSSNASENQGWNISEGNQNNENNGGEDESCGINDCDDGYFCRFDDNVCGEDGAEGVCEPLTDSCTDDIATVCGCDGQFYYGSSSCAASHQGGVDSHQDHSFCEQGCLDPDDPAVFYVAESVEECQVIDFSCEAGQEGFDNDCGCGCIQVEDPPESCATGECDDGYYCSFSDGVCGEDGGQGTCQPLPEFCTDDLTTVCGCDGEFYHGSSSCAAQYDGRVDSTSNSSICETDDDCLDPDDPDVEYVGDSVEECALIFFGCDDDEEHFHNDCGCGCVKIDGTPESCTIDGCPTGMYCHYDDFACGATGAEGVCTSIPDLGLCTPDQTDTCGCNGEYYTGSSTCPGTFDDGVHFDNTGNACAP